MSASRARDLFTLAVGLAVVVVDQLTKAWIVQYFVVAEGRPPIPILGQILTLWYVQNPGVAFSMFTNSNIKFILIGVALLVVVYLYWRFRDAASPWLLLGFALVIGGAAGNLIDRFTHQYVVDFIHFQIPGKFDFFVFNIADSAITIGVVIIAIVLYFTNMASAPQTPAPMTSSVKAITREPEAAEGETEASAQVGAGDPS